MPARLRRYVGRILRRYRRSRVRLDASDILGALERAGNVPGESLMVHSSLSACGTMEQGPRTVIHALREWLGERNLVLPTHTYCYPAVGGVAPIYDARVTQSRVGAISNYYRELPQVRRSIHPSHSIAASGPDALGICDGHERCSTPCGKGTPYERLIESGCSVLMFGVTLNAYTFFHTAEDAAEVPYLYEDEPYPMRYTDAAGQVCEMKMRRHDLRVPRRFAAVDHWLEARALLRRCPLGIGELLFLSDALAVHRAVVDELRENPLFLVDRAASAPVAARVGISL